MISNMLFAGVEVLAVVIIVCLILSIWNIHCIPTRSMRFALCAPLLIVIVLLGIMGMVFSYMRAEEVLTYEHLAVNQRYEVVDRPILYPNGWLIYAIADSHGDIRLYRLGNTISGQTFHKRFNGATHTTWLEVD